MKSRVLLWVAGIAMAVASCDCNSTEPVSTCDIGFMPAMLPGPVPLNTLTEARLIGEAAERVLETSDDPSIVEIVGRSPQEEVQFVCRSGGMSFIRASFGIDCFASLPVICEDDASGMDGGTGGTGGTGTPGQANDPTNDCVRNSVAEACNAVIDAIGASAQCVDFAFPTALATKGLPGNTPFAFVAIETDAGVSNQLPDDGSVFRAGCTMFGDDSADTLAFRCIARNGGPWTNEFPPELDDGTELDVDEGEGCAVVDGALRMAIAQGKLPFAPAEVGCSTGVSNGPGTTVNDFVERFAFGDGCAAP